MLRIATAIVTGVVYAHPGMQELEVKMNPSGKRERAIAYTDAEFKPGDEVLLNTTAVRLGLGTGGTHFVIAQWEKAGGKSREEADLFPNTWGHLVKMRYSPYQMAVDTVEEQGSPFHGLFADESLSLEHTPVLIGELHSLLPAAAAACKAESPQSRIVYVMPDGASLPIALSRQVQRLQERGLLCASVTTGHAWGGDLETVTIHSGLLAARHVAKADIICCFLGPGVAGTGTPLGFSGMQLAEVIHAVSLLGGVPVFVPRISFADPRDRHRGISHHSRTVLKRFALRPSLLNVPFFHDERDDLLQHQCHTDQLEQQHLLLRLLAPDIEYVRELDERYQLHLSTMGRSLLEDPSPFQTAVAAARLAVRSREWLVRESSGEWNRCGGQDILAALAAYLTSCEV
ncbi:DUF3866 family protein [Brevibacillus sp. H7]|uniref:DUF3866 family protein n=1 Tax=Brevibacillus sp. H7 TaxID=3349138 RepID=UPI0037F29461